MSAPFPSPPGLDAHPLGGNAGLTDAAEEHFFLQHLCSHADQQAIIQAIKDSVVRDVDARVAEKADELWQRGKQMLGQMQQKHKERTSQLTEEVARCQANCMSLEEENAKLKQALGGLAARFYSIGQAMNGKEALLATPCTTADSDALAAVSLSPEAPDPFFTPAPSPEGAGRASGSGGRGEGAGAGEASSADGTLPLLPDFPFPGGAALSPVPGAPLSLSEALGTRTPQRTPLSLATSLSPALTTSPEVAFPWLQGPEVFSFTFTLRKADGADLGLNVSHHETDKVLRIEGVREGGAVEAWNKQCAGSEKAVHAGDRILRVNNVMGDPHAMLEECQMKQLLKLTVVRGDGQQPLPPAPAAPLAKEVPHATLLRADASVFVPKGADATEAPAVAEAGSERASASCPRR